MSVIKFRPKPQFDKSATILLLDQDIIKKKVFPGLAYPPLKNSLENLLKTQQFAGDKGEIFPIIFDGKIFLVAGLGKAQECTLRDIRIVVRKALLSVFLKTIKSVELIPHKNDDEVIKAIIEGIVIGSYVWEKYRSSNTDNERICKKDVCLVSVSKKIYEETITICQGVNYTRDLINDNADLITSDYFEKEVRKITKGIKNVAISILNEKELRAKGLNLHLAVNQGSNKKPKLIIIKYRGNPHQKRSIALVGKGLTFDSGGLNLKPSGSIETMRSDMSGAAALMGVLKNVINLKIKKNIIFAIGLAENAIGSKSYKPGDIIKSYNGLTVEIGNTDAEGRLVLADAISFVIKNYKPNQLIDIATLTGACTVALGYDYSGLMTPDQNFADKLLKISGETDDLIWQLPSYPELKDSIKSDIADLKNISNQRGAGGTITAAEFLRQFTENTPWAHLDIASTAFLEGKGRTYYGYGATGAGVRLLTHYLKNYQE